MQKQPDGPKVTDPPPRRGEEAHDDAVKTGDQIKKTGEDIGKSDAAQRSRTAHELAAV